MSGTEQLLNKMVFSVMIVTVTMPVNMLYKAPGSY